MSALGGDLKGSLPSQDWGLGLHLYPYIASYLDLRYHSLTKKGDDQFLLIVVLVSFRSSIY
jgi:hypothetical protein